MDKRITALEEQVAFLTRALDEISEVVARQDRELTGMDRRVAMLLEREARREAETTNTIPLADEKPPHW